MIYTVTFKFWNPFFLPGLGGPVHRSNSAVSLGKENEN